MPIFSFVQTKGGTGKTTLSQGVACSKTFAKAFGKVALVEIDPQGTLADWIGERIANKRALKNVAFHQLVGLDLGVLTSKLEKIVEENTAVILDVPGESVGGFATKLALNLSDLVFIPMRTSTNDEASFGRNLWPVIQESLRENKAAFHIVPTFIHPQTNTKNIQEYFRGIMPEQIDCLGSVLPFRSVFENFSREGMTLAEYSASVKGNNRLHAQAKKAEIDMETIAQEIVKLTKE
ncbi:ParA family protein [Desulfoprunum benzoelyticum]|uniref:Cellulose biosynthesis protein BcsQ n=1 Tax=Desulfoprunum benzoelyticum TaxID=1506996 RepID=A0A840UXN7_9BACT|nr:ParA family protein [Desulfoprunum benzoelyticum]MBB5349576.1 cellulose biosynthesis protein BcsQ [Desulfoprunum benzoelyticum]MBM9531332.1 ParA family protein [Desulfoprunum benzoelyticum]